MTPHLFPFGLGMRATRTLPGGAVEEFAVLAVVTCTDGVVRLAWATDTDLEADDADDGDWGYTRADACTPVDCGATRGELLEAVREAWKDPAIHLGPTSMLHPDGTSPMWFVYTGRGKGPVGYGPTEFAALVAAYNAAPRSTP